MCEKQSAFTSTVSIKSGMTCCMKCAMFVSTVLYCCDVMSHGGGYVFATVMCLFMCAWSWVCF